MRREVGLDEVALIDAQSDRIDDWAAAMLMAHNVDEAALEADLMRAVQAGHDVGEVLDGADVLILDRPPGSDELAGALRGLADHPASHAVLLDPSCDAIAVGASPRRSAVIVATYSYADGDGAERMRAAVGERIEAARAERGLDPMRRPSSSVRYSLERTASQITERRRSPSSARGRLGQRLAYSVRSTVWSRLQFVQAAEDFEIPDEFLTEGFDGAYTVTPYVPAGSSWVWYVVIYAWW